VLAEPAQKDLLARCKQLMNYFQNSTNVRKSGSFTNQDEQSLVLTCTNSNCLRCSSFLANNNKNNVLLHCFQSIPLAAPSNPPKTIAQFNSILSRQSRFVWKLGRKLAPEFRPARAFFPRSEIKSG
jgi:uncharacterized FlgJ-related protein